MQDNLVSAYWTRPASPALKIAVPLLLGVALLAVSARVQIPFWPVPMTLQTLAVLVIGAACGARLGAATVLAYIAAGIAGLPVFAGGAGPAYLFGPTGGYLAGFVAAAWIVGHFADRGHGRSVMEALAVLAIADAAIFALGVGWLAAAIGFEAAVAAGLVPFIPAELLKIALAAALWPVARARAPR